MEAVGDRDKGKRSLEQRVERRWELQIRELSCRPATAAVPGYRSAHAVLLGRWAGVESSRAADSVADRDAGPSPTPPDEGELGTQ